MEGCKKMTRECEQMPFEELMVSEAAVSTIPGGRRRDETCFRVRGRLECAHATDDLYGQPDDKDALGRHEELTKQLWLDGRFRLDLLYCWMI